MIPETTKPSIHRSYIPLIFFFVGIFAVVVFIISVSVVVARQNPSIGIFK